MSYKLTYNDIKLKSVNNLHSCAYFVGVCLKHYINKCLIFADGVNWMYLCFYKCLVYGATALTRLVIFYHHSY